MKIKPLYLWAGLWAAVASLLLAVPAFSQFAGSAGFYCTPAGCFGPPMNTNVTNTGVLNTNAINDSGPLNVGGLSSLGVTQATALTCTGFMDTGNAAVNGNLTVGGVTTVGTLNSNALMCTGLTDSGNAAVAGTFSVTGSSTLAGTSVTSLTDSGTLNVSGLSSLTNVSVSGTLSTNVDSPNTLNTNVLNANYATVNTNLTVTGSTVLGVMAATSISSSSITDLGPMSIAGTTTAQTVNANALTCTSFADSGNATITGTLSVSGVFSSANGNFAAITDTGPLSVAGTTTAQTINANALSCTTLSDTESAITLGFQTSHGANANTVTIGNNSTTGATSAVAIGDLSNASGLKSTAVGYGANASTTSVAVGDVSNASGGSSAAFGISALAQGSGSLACGLNPNATDTDAIALGDLSLADFRSVAIGRSTSATGGNAFAAGAFTTAAGSGALAILGTATGANAIAIEGSCTGSHCVTLGQGTQNSNISSAAIGTGAKTTADHQIMLGTSAETVVMPGNFTAQGTANAVGTVTSGTWNGSTIGPTFGGTGLAAYALGDMIYSSATNTLARLAGNTTTTKQFLTQTGTGTVSAAPVWGVLAAGDIPSTLNATTMPTLSYSTTGAPALRNSAATGYGFGSNDNTHSSVYTNGNLAVNVDSSQSANFTSGAQFNANVIAPAFLSTGATQLPDAGAKFSAFGVTGVAGGNAYYYAQDSTATNKCYMGVTSASAFLGAFSNTQFDLRQSNTARMSLLTTGQIGTAGQGTAAAPILTLTSAPSTGIYYPTTTSWAVSTNGLNAVTVDSGQNASFSAATTFVGNSNHIGNVVDNQNFQVVGATLLQGQFAASIRTVTASGNVSATDYTVKLNTTSGNVTMTLPPASSQPVGRILNFVKVSTDNNVASFAPNGTDQINGVNAAITWTAAYTSFSIQTDGVNWVVF